MRPYPDHALCLVAVEPVVHGVRLPGSQQPGLGDRERRLPSRNLHQGGGSFADLRMRIVIPSGKQLLPLLISEREVAFDDHNRPSSEELPHI